MGEIMDKLDEEIDRMYRNLYDPETSGAKMLAIVDTLQRVFGLVEEPALDTIEWHCWLGLRGLIEEAKRLGR